MNSDATIAILANATLIELIEFTESESFREVVNDLNNCKREEKDRFIKDILLNKAELTKRGLMIPTGITIERSYFFDERPTLFCVVKYLKDSLHKVTITFDDKYIENY